MAKPTWEQLIENFPRTKLIEDDQWESLKQEWQQTADDSVKTDVDAFLQFLVDKEAITPWHMENLLSGKYKGFFLGSYKLLKHVGAGGMSSVYLGEHTMMGRQVAIKILPRSRVSSDTSYLQRFMQEAQAAASLNHPNIVTAYDIDNENGIYYFVMEYVDGKDLNGLVKADGPLDYAVAADYICQAACGLAHAHERGLIHRDMKPANLLVDPNGTVKILDMGLALFSESDRASLTLAYDENVLGTADYLAPEQARNSHTVDARADIYSLGCTLYFLLTGHPPFTEGTLPQRILAHQQKNPPEITVDRPDCPADLVAICKKMMMKKPEQRQQSMVEVQGNLTDWLLVHGYLPNNESMDNIVRARNRLDELQRSIESPSDASASSSSGDSVVNLDFGFGSGASGSSSKSPVGHLGDKKKGGSSSSNKKKAGIFAGFFTPGKKPKPGSGRKLGKQSPEDSDVVSDELDPSASSSSTKSSALSALVAMADAIEEPSDNKKNDFAAFLNKTAQAQENKPSTVSEPAKPTPKPAQKPAQNFVNGHPEPTPISVRTTPAASAGAAEKSGTGKAASSQQEKLASAQTAVGQKAAPKPQQPVKAPVNKVPVNKAPQVNAAPKPAPRPAASESRQEISASKSGISKSGTVKPISTKPGDKKQRPVKRPKRQASSKTTIIIGVVCAVAVVVIGVILFFVLNK
ncbi:MAG: protein kinase [Thermoguttaceae bacterium]|nr:protein kinase [Thermoguttaceae bacterium]